MFLTTGTFPLAFEGALELAAPLHARSRRGTGLFAVRRPGGPQGAPRPRPPEALARLAPSAAGQGLVISQDRQNPTPAAAPPPRLAMATGSIADGLVVVRSSCSAPSCRAGYTFRTAPAVDYKRVAPRGVVNSCAGSRSSFGRRLAASLPGSGAGYAGTRFPCTPLEGRIFAKTAAHRTSACPLQCEERRTLTSGFYSNAIPGRASHQGWNGFAA